MKRVMKFFLALLFLSYCLMYIWKQLEPDGYVGQYEAHLRIRRWYEGDHRSLQDGFPAATNDRMAALSPVKNDEFCGVGNDCSCWILTGVSDHQEIEGDIGFYHFPRTLLLRKLADRRDFAVISLQAIDNNAYSVLGCYFDWSALKPV